MKDIVTYIVKDVNCKTTELQKEEVIFQCLSDYLNRKIAYYSDTRDYEHKEIYEDKKYHSNREIEHG